MQCSEAGRRFAVFKCGLKGLWGSAVDENRETEERGEFISVYRISLGGSV